MRWTIDRVPLSGVAVYVITDPGVLCENRNTLLGIVDEVNQIGRGDLLGGVEHVLLKVHAELHPDVVAEAKIINSNRASDDSALRTVPDAKRLLQHQQPPCCGVLSHRWSAWSKIKGIWAFAEKMLANAQHCNSAPVDPTTRCFFPRLEPTNCRARAAGIASTGNRQRGRISQQRS